MLGKIKTKQEKSGEIIAYSETAVANNAAVVEYCKISMAALSGGTAGLLGLTGLYGFGFYIFAVFGLWAMLLMKAGGQWRKYFISRRHLLTSGFFGGLCIFIWNGSRLLSRKRADALQQM
ncbi:ER membrane protein complex subunit 6 isoform X1 [Solenopsis invicta]|uniref:ER membrane protein complex subunit 6 isoform X1 n=1 Tax=Solenopsis invicta TaxID=13686 RepID=UPI00193D6254|nr:ER membrane protein complex subunit 6 isoform X1 [Solenopsis invicta]